jgi:hypothetical protein
MIEFCAYRENPAAPVCLVNKVGGIYLVSQNLLKVTLICDSPGPGRSVDTIATAHLMWTSHSAWLESHRMCEFAISEFKRGTLLDDGGQFARMQ